MYGILYEYVVNLNYKIISLDMKGCIFHLTKWQIHPFISKETKYVENIQHFLQVTFVHKQNLLIT